MKLKPLKLSNMWANVFPDNSMSVYPTKEGAETAYFVGNALKYRAVPCELVVMIPDLPVDNSEEKRRLAMQNLKEALIHAAEFL